LGHSEILSVKNPPGDAIPAFDQPAKDDSEVGSPVAGKKARDVFDNHPLRLKLCNNSMELKPKPALLSNQARPLSGNGHVLAGESSANKVNWCNCIWSDISHISDDWHAEMLPQHATRLGVDLTLPNARHAGTLQAKIKSTDTAEQRTEIHFSFLLLLRSTL